MLRQGEHCLVLDLGVLGRAAGWNPERSTARSVPTWESQNTACCWTSGSGSLRTDSSRSPRFRAVLLGHEEDSLPAKAGRAGIAPGQNASKDRAGHGLVHLQQRVERGHLHVVVVVGARPSRSGRRTGYGRACGMASEGSAASGGSRRGTGGTGGTGPPPPRRLRPPGAAASGSPRRASSPWIRRSSVAASPWVAALGKRSRWLPQRIERHPQVAVAPGGTARTPASRGRPPHSPSGGSERNLGKEVGRGAIVAAVQRLPGARGRENPRDRLAAREPAAAGRPDRPSLVQLRRTRVTSGRHRRPPARRACDRMPNGIPYIRELLELCSRLKARPSSSGTSRHPAPYLQ